MQNRTVRYVSVALGLWVVLTSFFVHGHAGLGQHAAALNARLTGIIVMLTGAASIRFPGLRYVTAAAGVWLVASLFAWPNTGSVIVWSTALVGAAIALVSLVGPEEIDMTSS